MILVLLGLVLLFFWMKGRKSNPSPLADSARRGAVSAMPISPLILAHTIPSGCTELFSYSYDNLGNEIKTGYGYACNGNGFNYDGTSMK